MANRVSLLGKPLHNVSDVSRYLGCTREIPSRRHGRDSKQIRHALSNDHFDAPAVLQRAQQSAAAGEPEDQLRPDHVRHSLVGDHRFGAVARHHESAAEGTRRIRLDETGSADVIRRGLPQPPAHVTLTPSLLEVLGGCGEHQEGVRRGREFGFVIARPQT